MLKTQCFSREKNYRYFAYRRIESKINIVKRYKFEIEFSSRNNKNCLNAINTKKILCILNLNGKDK